MRISTDLLERFYTLRNEAQAGKAHDALKAKGFSVDSASQGCRFYELVIDKENYSIYFQIRISRIWPKFDDLGKGQMSDWPWEVRFSKTKFH